MYFDPRIDKRPAPLVRDPFPALVVPRPIGWISTIDAGGTANLAPFSHFNIVSTDPPCVMFCPSGPHADGGLLDSLANLSEVPEFVVNLADADLQDEVVLSSAHVDRNVDEFQLTKLAKAPSSAVRPPRVARAKAALECEVERIVGLPAGAGGRINTMVIGLVVGIHIEEGIIRDGLVDIAAMRPLSRLGYLDYAVIEDSFTKPRP